jgi:hypothetical protein
MMYTRAELARVFRDAADHIAADCTDYGCSLPLSGGCCEAICYEAAFPTLEAEALNTFTHWFNPESGLFWWVNPYVSSEDQVARALALEFMALVCETEESLLPFIGYQQEA